MGESEGVEDLWGARTRDWVAHQEPQFVPLYEHAFEAMGVRSGLRLVDAGCGAGLAVAMAVARGATVSGFDPSPALLAIARQRVPEADLRLGGIEQPPHEPEAFDLITMFNVAHHAGDAALFRRFTTSVGPALGWPRPLGDGPSSLTCARCSRRWGPGRRLAQT